MKLTLNPSCQFIQRQPRVRNKPTALRATSWIQPSKVSCLMMASIHGNPVKPCQRTQPLNSLLSRFDRPSLGTCSSHSKRSKRYLRNRKHVPCYRVIETRVEVWENEKCCGNTSRRRVFPQLFRVLPNFHECFYNSIETRRTCFLFLLENTATKKRKATC